MQRKLLLLAGRARSVAQRTSAFALAAHAQVTAGSPGWIRSKWDRRIFGTLVAVGALHGTAQAQAINTTLNQFKSTVITIGQIIFAIFLMVGLVKTAKKFIGGEPDAMTSLMWLAGGVLLFFGFQAFKDQIVSNSGGGQGGVQ